MKTTNFISKIGILTLATMISCTETEIKETLDARVPLVQNSCHFNGKKIEHGDSIQAAQSFSVQFGNTCSFEERICDNGELDGSFEYSSCQVREARSCNFNGKNIPHGQSVQSYENHSVAFGGSCLSQERTCNDGDLSGSYSFSSCQEENASACYINGHVVAHGESITLNESISVAYGSSCNDQERTCTNGTLSGSYIFPYCSEEAPKSCVFEGKQYAHNESIVKYKESSVAYGVSCESEIVKCNNGNMSANFTQGRCQVEAPKNCMINDQEVLHGQYTTLFMYANPVEEIGGSCNGSYNFCNNGELGDDRFPHSTCRVKTCPFDAVDEDGNCHLNKPQLITNDTYWVYAFTYDGVFSIDKSTNHISRKTGPFKDSTAVKTFGRDYKYFVYTYGQDIYEYIDKEWKKSEAWETAKNSFREDLHGGFLSVRKRWSNFYALTNSGDLCVYNQVNWRCGYLDPDRYYNGQSFPNSYYNNLVDFNFSGSNINVYRHDGKVHQFSYFNYYYHGVIDKKLHFEELFSQRSIEGFKDLSYFSRSSLESSEAYLDDSGVIYLKKSKTISGQRVISTKVLLDYFPSF